MRRARERVADDIGESEYDFELSRRLLRLPDWALLQLVRSLNWPQARDLMHRWSLFAHPGQFRPAGNWRVWLIRAGRGFGKTRAGSEWVCEIARDVPGAQIALVGASVEDVVKVMIRGPSGLLSVARRDQKARFRAASSLVEFAGGATAHIYSAEAPEKLRGPEHDVAWCDELAKWRDGGAAWDNLMMGLRRSDHPRTLVTTTPRTNALMHRVMALSGLIESRGRTSDNLHLSPAYLKSMNDIYGGTRLGRQELDGELLVDADGALWTRALLEECRIAAADPGTLELVRVVVGVDPPASVGGDACGIVACGVDADGIGYVLGDASVAGLRPEGWARAVAECAARYGADRVIAEKNNGGDMVRSVLNAAEVRLPIKLVHASRGKSARAEPIAAKYEIGAVKHVGPFPALEDQLAGMLVASGYAGPGNSPDRADACVWALTELMLGPQSAARINSI